MPIKSEFSNAERPKRVTLQDIAELAGVKKMTVSDALNGTRRVAPATRERVRRIARELNYIPNSAARALATGRTGVIAVLSGPMSQPYYANMVDLLESHINDNGFNLMLMRTPREVHELVTATGNTSVDGAIAIDMMGLVLEFRSHPSIPCVSLGSVRCSFVDSVVVDLEAGVEEAMRLMVARGRRRIAYFVTATVLTHESEGRARAYFSAMQRADLEPEIINVITDDSALIEERLRAYIEKNGCPGALLCQNDETAMCAFRVLRDAGFRVPDDVLLVGCDGQLHMKYFDPPLSTIVQPMKEMCATAWQFLQARINNPDLPHQEAMLHGKLVVRESLAPLSKSGRNV